MYLAVETGLIASLQPNIHLHKIQLHYTTTNFAFLILTEMNKKLVGYLAFFLVLVGGFFFFLFRGTDNWKAKLPTTSYVRPFSFTDQDGKTVTEKTVDGKIYVADFFFTRCGSICPKMTGNMALLQTRFNDDDDVIFLSHSVTPTMDSVPALKKYAEEKGVISGKWHLLTGDKDAIYTIAKKQYYAGDTVGYYQTGNEFLHTENFILVDKHRRIRGVYNGTLALEMERLGDDVETLRREE